MTEPLSKGEHVDLDGTTVWHDEKSDGSVFKVWNHDERGSDFSENILLKDEEIRELAELAGFTVIEGDNE